MTMKKINKTEKSYVIYKGIRNIFVPGETPQGSGDVRIKRLFVCLLCTVGVFPKFQILKSIQDYELLT